MPFAAPHYSVSTDVALFSIHAGHLDVLLVHADAARWRLPGGPPAQEEDLDASALRHLASETGVTGVYLEQLYSFGDPRRDPVGPSVSVAYYALAPIAPATLRAVERSPRLGWHPVGGLPPTLMDHDRIVTLAHQRLAAKLAYSTIALQFMPERFTLSALQSVYETILGESLDKRNFRKRVLAMDCIEATDQFLREGNHRPARLYRVTRPGKIDFIR